MDATFVLAAGSCFVLAIGHWLIGRRWVLPGLSRTSLPGTPFGPPALSAGMVRFTWHVVTMFLVAFATLLLALGRVADGGAVPFVLRWFATVWLAAAALAGWQARRRPSGLLRFPVPFLFLAVAVLSWLASASDAASLVSVTAVSTTVGMDRFPQAIRSLTTLPRVDYGDLFTARTAAAQTRSPEAWARTLLEETPLARDSARRLWRLLGLRLGPQYSSDHVQGWRIADRGVGWIRLETGSWYMSAQALLHVEDQQVSISLFLQYQNPFAAVVWAPVGAMHRRGVPVMLRQAVTAVESTGG